VVPGEDGELVQARDQVPARSGVARDEDGEGDDGEGVHLQYREDFCGVCACHGGSRCGGIYRAIRGSDSLLLPLTFISLARELSPNVPSDDELNHIETTTADSDRT